MREPSLLFWRQYLRRPLGIGAIAPSSPSLARAMVAALRAKSDDVVVELGPGTGVFTRELVKCGIAGDRLILIEFDPGFAAYLRKAFKGVTVIEGDARQLPGILSKLNRGRVPKVLSGLPLRSMKPETRSEIAEAVANSLEPGGTLVQFTYFSAPPLPQTEWFEVERTGMVLANLPPAFIWRYVRRTCPQGKAC
jgi:phosphatidylethanolamine/phosphatidyl-N-methylethanolamine N-methyltransferase